jgi:hypothetical protein
VDQIKAGVETVWHLIVESYQARDWEVLGYATWDEMCAREFGTARLRLPSEQRAEKVQSLRAAGLSLRAIESVTGHSQHTIIQDTQVLQSAAPDEQTSTQETDRRVTGMDGKSYARSAQRAPSRKPLADEFRGAGLDLDRIVTRLGRLAGDDRFKKNADQIAQSYLHDLVRARDALQCVIDQLTQKG